MMMFVMFLLASCACALDCESNPSSCVYVDEPASDEVSLLSVSTKLHARHGVQQNVQTHDHRLHGPATSEGPASHRSPSEMPSKAQAKQDLDLDLDLVQAEPMQAAPHLQVVEHNQTDHNQTDMSKKPAQEDGSNLITLISNQIEFELHKTSRPVVDKLLIVILETTILGCCGVDRCCMGQCCLGTIKGLTFGGLGIWAAIDYWVLNINAFTKAKSIDAVGLVADWKSDSIQSAFIAACILVPLNLLCGCCSVCAGGIGRGMAEGLATAK